MRGACAQTSLAGGATTRCSVQKTLSLHTLRRAGVVFEGRDRGGQLRAIFGGGRYDGLLSTFGGEARPCAGFGFGDCVIVELLADKGLLPALPQQVRQQ